MLHIFSNKWSAAFFVNSSSFAPPNCAQSIVSIFWKYAGVISAIHPQPSFSPTKLFGKVVGRDPLWEVQTCILAKNNRLRPNGIRTTGCAWSCIRTHRNDVENQSYPWLWFYDSGLEAWIFTQASRQYLETTCLKTEIILFEAPSSTSTWATIVKVIYTITCNSMCFSYDISVCWKRVLVYINLVIKKLKTVF